MTAWYDITATHFTKGQLQPDSAKRRHFWTNVREAALIVQIAPYADFSPRSHVSLTRSSVRLSKLEKNSRLVRVQACGGQLSGFLMCFWCVEFDMRLLCRRAARVKKRKKRNRGVRTGPREENDTPAEGGAHCWTGSFVGLSPRPLFPSLPPPNAHTQIRFFLYFLHSLSCNSRNICSRACRHVLGPWVRREAEGYTVRGRYTINSSTPFFSLLLFSLFLFCFGFLSCSAVLLKSHSAHHISHILPLPPPTARSWPGIWSNFLICACVSTPWSFVFAPLKPHERGFGSGKTETERCF